METIDLVFPQGLRHIDPPGTTTRRRQNQRNRIFIRQLKLHARIGVYAWEKAALQPIILDIEYALPNAIACHTDCIDDTIDYGSIVERLRAVALEKHCELVERLAERMAEVIQLEYGVPWLQLTLTKLAPIPGVEVGITIERGDET